MFTNISPTLKYCDFAAVDRPDDVLNVNCIWVQIRVFWHIACSMKNFIRLKY